LFQELFNIATTAQTTEKKKAKMQNFQEIDNNLAGLILGFKNIFSFETEFRNCKF
jgi:predicted alpha/beta-fold hydrolase